MTGIVKREARFFDKEILLHPAGFDSIKNVVIDANEIPAAGSDGRWVIPAGMVLVGSGSDTDQVQHVHVTGSPTGGTFRLKWNDEETGDLAYNISAADLNTAVEALTNLETADVAVTGTAPDYVVTFGGKYSGSRVAMIQLADNSLTGGSDPTVEVELVTEGKAEKVKPAAASGISDSDVVGILAHEVEFWGENDDNFDKAAAAFHHGCVFDQEKLINYSGNVTAVQTALSTCKFGSK